MTATALAVLDVARGELGYAEDPPGSNRTRYGAWYGMDGQPWCAMFVSWCAARAGAADIIPRHAYTPAGAEWFRARGAFVDAPRAGDVVYFRWPGMGRIAHVAFVESVRPDGSVVTIEGNTDAAGGRTGGRVMRHVRRAHIAGYGRPAYAGGGGPATVLAGADEGRVAEDGQLGPQTVRALQRALGVGVDGELGPVTTRALQELLGVPADGEIGPVTTRALQQALGVGVDGDWGPLTTRALQHALNERAAPFARVPVPAG
ncbi:CHAP domain-containing protein [Kineococcus glutinatus]|uniref:CHAP domain-containing protein n=1 Tax=Kineococcus glutinatus TaxID=1070872 RepID=A0ABP8VEF1_9ACTN